MNRIVPVIVVIGAGAVPAAVLVLQRRMLPVIAGILSAHDDSLTSVAQRPDIISVDLLDVPLDAGRLGRRQDGRGLGQRVSHHRVGLDAGHVRPAGQRLHQSPVTI